MLVSRIIIVFFLSNSIIESPATFAGKMSPATYYLQMSPGRAKSHLGVPWSDFALHAHLCKKKYGSMGKGYVMSSGLGPPAPGRFMTWR